MRSKRSVRAVQIMFVLLIGLFLTLAGVALSAIVSPAEVVAKVVTDQSPQPHLPILQKIPQVAVDPLYLEQAKRIGWSGAAKIQETAEAEAAQAKLANAFDSWLIDHHIPVYETNAVYTYLNKLTSDATAKEKERCSTVSACGWRTYSWEWFPLEGRTPSSFYLSTGGMLSLGDSQSLRVFGSTSTAANADQVFHVATEEYTQPIPRAVLATMDEIKDCWPDAKFSVSRIDAKLDPFLMVRFDWGTRIVAKWDEPGF